MPATEDQLRALMRCSLDGDARAHEKLLRLLEPILRCYFRRRLRNAEFDVDDLVQESLIAVHSRRATYNRSRLLMPWVYAVARYKLADHFRQRRQDAGHRELKDEHAFHSFEDASISRIDVSRLLKTLSSKQAMAIRATKIDGESVADVAAAKGLTEADVKVSVHRGLKALTARFSGAGL